MKCFSKFDFEESLKKLGVSFVSSGSLLTKENVDLKFKITGDDLFSGVYQGALFSGTDQRYIKRHLLVYDDKDSLLGYITISYMKEDTFKEMFPTIKHWMMYQKCHDINVVKSFFNSSVGKKDRLLNSRKYYEISNRLYDKEDEEETSYDEIYDKYMELLTIQSRQKENKIKFEQDFINKTKPLPDFSRVHCDFQRQHIAVQMYVAFAKEISKDNLKLYSSDNQSDDAKKLWKYIEKRYPDATTKIEYKDRTEYIMDGSKL